MANVLIATRDASKVIFSDVNLDVNVESPFELVYNEDSINKSIITILSTRIGSRVFRRYFGSKIVDLVFEPMDDITVDRIRLGIIDAVGRWENRIKLIKTEVLPDIENQQYFVSLEYLIPALNNKSAVFTFNLLAGK